MLLLIILCKEISGSLALLQEDNNIFDEFPTADSSYSLLAAAANISEKCLKDSQQQLDAFRRSIPWAVKSIKIFYFKIFKELILVELN